MQIKQRAFDMAEDSTLDDLVVMFKEEDEDSNEGADPGESKIAKTYGDYDGYSSNSTGSDFEGFIIEESDVKDTKQEDPESEDTEADVNVEGEVEESNVEDEPEEKVNEDSDDSTDGVISNAEMSDEELEGEQLRPAWESQKAEERQSELSKFLEMLGNNVAIKTEVEDDALMTWEGSEDCITILVPNDIDEKTIKMEPEDSEYLELGASNGGDEMDEDEDFYIIQVQEPEMEVRARRTRRPITPVPHKALNQCDLCNYQTYDKSNLHKHRLIHTDEKPYSCDACPFTCKLPKYLKQHKVTHMTERRFPCSLCCHRCRNVTELNRHLKRHMRLMQLESLAEATGREVTYCVCRDGCKATGLFKKLKRDK